MSDQTMHDDDMYDDGAGRGEKGSEGPLPPACAEFDELLADYLEGTLAPAARAAMDAHRAGCARCDALVADLEGLALAARALPSIVPSGAATDAMWRGVSARISPPAVSIGTARSAAPRLRYDGWRRQVAAAAALVLLTAGVTYSVTRVIDGGDRGRVVAVGGGRGATAAGPVAPRSGDSARLAAGDDVPSPLAAAGTGDAPATSVGGAGTSVGGAGTRVVRGVAPRLSVAATYEHEIRGLDRILHERRGELDSTTVAVLERNLAVIDQAIRQSREALERDPRSRFLGQQLNSALDKKVELLRTAAMLPSRT